ncbi:MAG TPA: ATP-binding protein [Ktedonobacteraceae bacterium]|nr:ATP-binding protein [Ktedonobacteraceae bacterium]
MEHQSSQINVPGILTALLAEFSAVTDYRTLRDSLPRRLANLLGCRCVVLYQRIDETLQFIAGSFNDAAGWSADLLSVAHINPVGLSSDLPEAGAWRKRRAVASPVVQSTLVAVPLIYRHRAIGVLSAIHVSEREAPSSGPYWCTDDIVALEAIVGVVALLLENTRLLEHDRERIHELSLLNSIGSQLNCSLYELARLRSVVVQRAREIANTDCCDLLEMGPESAVVPWIDPQLKEQLFQHFQAQAAPAPLVIERPGDAANPSFHVYLEQLPEMVKTFFAFPLVSGRTVGRRGGSLLWGSLGSTHEGGPSSKVLGIIVGAHHQPWKIHRAEEVLLRVLASQASTVLENIALVGEVIDARNEARKLLRKVLDDQRLKELILASIPSGLVTTDCHGVVTTFNRASEAILGYHPYEALGQPLHTFLDLRQADSPSTIMRADAQQDGVSPDLACLGDIHGGTVPTVDRQGREVMLDVDVLPLYDDLGVVIGLLITFTDVTSVHRLEEEKRRLDRLASLGEMSANVAHEVRNPLASIKTSMQMLKEDLCTENDAETLSNEQVAWAQESVSVALKEVERLDTIVRDLLLFAKPRQLHRASTSLIEMCEQVLKLLQVQCAEANVVVHRVYSELPATWVDVGQMEQVLWNIVMNALQAMPDGGILTVTCRELPAEQALLSATDPPPATQGRFATDAGQPKRRQQAPSPASQWVEVVISDTGMGIPPDQLERIFQPFFTTKAHGIGLGLAITRRLIEDHGGYIRVDGQFGYGTSIAVRLPVLNEEKKYLSAELNESVGEMQG